MTVKYILQDLCNQSEEDYIRSFVESSGNMFGENNSKISNTSKEYGYKGASFDLLAGHTCPAASLCHSRVVLEGGHRVIEDLGQFRCYATKSEVLYTNVYEMHKRNFDLTKIDDFPLIMSYVIRSKKLNLVRIHSAGDMYDFTYFKKWIAIAQINPSVIFFGYSKQATFIRHLLDNPVDNLKMVYSYGGLHDNYALKVGLPSCTVVTRDYAYNIHGTREYRHKITGEYAYVNGKGKTLSQVYSPVRLEYGTFYNHIKGCVENLSCTHDTRRSSVDDFERIMRGESFGIVFH